jgi:hypothetical protein
MYTNSFIKEQMAQSQSCDREKIGLNLQVASDGIKKANCSDFNDLQAALNDLSELLLKKDDVSQSGSADSSSESAPQNAASASGPQNAAVPAPAPTSATASAPAASVQKYELNKDLVFRTVSGDPISLERIMNMLQTKKCKLDGPKCGSVLTDIQNAISEDAIREIIGKLHIYQNSIDSKSGGTRKRKTTRRKRAKTLKNKKKVGKRK